MVVNSIILSRTTSAALTTYGEEIFIGTQPPGINPLLILGEENEDPIDVIIIHRGENKLNELSALS